MPDPVKLFGVLVTYQRPGSLSETLDRLRAQTRQLDRLLVIDNGSSQAAREAVELQGADGFDAIYVDAGDNLGPAGGFALGMQAILDQATDSDWIFLFDDDDPPFFDEAIEDAVRFGQEMVSQDPDTGGVGISGGRFDVRTGRIVRIGDDQIHGPVPVDHITGGGLPAYRVRSVREIGVFLPELFFGFEELEFGLRLTRSGFKLYADGEMWEERKRVKRDLGLLPPEEVSERRAAQSSLRVTDASWRRFYSLRNLIYILRRSGATGTALRVAVGRGLLKPLLNLPRSPRVAWENLSLNWRAVKDGWRGRMGRTLEPGTAAD